MLAVRDEARVVWRPGLGRGAAVQRSGLRVQVVLERLVGHDFGRAELTGDGLRVDLVAVLARNVPAHRVVTREGAMAERTGYANALVPLSDVCAQVGLVAIGPLAERTLELRTWKSNVHY